jgi:hypothetical protein
MSPALACKKRRKSLFYNDLVRSSRICPVGGTRKVAAEREIRWGATWECNKDPKLGHNPI